MNLPQDFLVDYQTDPYEKKNASNGNEQIVRSLYQVALKYDTITPCLPEIPYGKGREGFKAPVEWKVTLLNESGLRHSEMQGMCY